MDTSDSSFLPGVLSQMNHKHKPRNRTEEVQNKIEYRKIPLISPGLFHNFVRGFEGAYILGGL